MPLHGWVFGLPLVGAAQAQHELRGIFRLAGQLIGRRLLEAENVDDFHDRLDTILEDASFHKVRNAIADLVFGRQEDQDHPSTLDREAIEAALSRVVDPELVPLHWEAFRYCALDGYYGRRLNRRHARRTRPAMDPICRAEDPLGFMANPDIPPLVARTLLGVLRLAACSFAMFEAAEQGIRLPAWLGAELGDLILKGARGDLVLLASLPESEVPLDVVPKEERIDPEELATRQETVKAVYALLGAVADQQNEKVWLPFGGGVADEHE